MARLFIGELDLARVPLGLSPEQAEFADEISSTVDRGAALVRQLLIFSRKKRLHLQDFNCSQAVVNLSKLLQRIVTENIEVRLNLAAQPLCIHADAGMIDQVLMNLVVTARDAMPAGGQLTIATVGVDFDAAAAAQSPPARPGAFVCLSVSDTGTGIPPDIRHRIFEPFFTTKEVGKGTGLGLATVFSIVQQHHGWITVTPEVTRGTTFEVYLPRLATPADSPKTAALLPPGSTGKETILVLEDDKSLLAALRLKLKWLGYRVLVAATGEQAEQVWSEHAAEIDLLLTDLMLPGSLSGKALAERLLVRNPKLKVVYMSGYSVEVAGWDLSLEEGINFLAKPFQTGHLAQTLRGRLDSTSCAPPRG